MSMKTWAMSKVSVAVEAAAFKNNTHFHDKLTALFQAVRDDGGSTESFAKLGMPAAIFEATGVSVRISIIEDWSANMGVVLAQLDKNSAIIPEIRRSIGGDSTLIAVQKLNKNHFTVGVDRTAGKVTGGMSLLTHQLIITSGMMNSEKYTAGMLSAGLIHELGHVYSYSERITDLFTINYAIYSAAEEMFKMSDPSKRVELISEFDKYMGVNIPDKENIVNSSRTEVTTHLCCEVIKQRRNAEGDMTYSYRGFEQSSDQFVTRHGAGLDLARTISQMEKDGFFRASTNSWPLHLSLELFKSVLFVAEMVAIVHTSPLLIIAPAIALLVSRPMDKIYDEPRARMERIKRDMMAELKNGNLNMSRRETILSDLAYLEPIAATINDKRTMWEAIWAYIIPAGNEARKRMEFQQSLEKLTSNELYVASALFSGK